MEDGRGGWITNLSIRQQRARTVRRLAQEAQPTGTGNASKLQHYQVVPGTPDAVTDGAPPPPPRGPPPPNTATHQDNDEATPPWLTHKSYSINY